MENNRSLFSLSSMDEDPLETPVMVATGRDKNSLLAVRWAVDNIKLKGTHLTLVHVHTGDVNINTNSYNTSQGAQNEHEIEKLFVPHRGYCGRKGVRAKEVIIHAEDIAQALGEYMNSHSVKTAVFGAPARSALARAFRNSDTTPSKAVKYAPDDCTVFEVSKGKTVKLKAATLQREPINSNATKSKTTPFQQETLFSLIAEGDQHKKHKPSSASNNNREYLCRLLSSTSSSPQSSSSSSSKYSSRTESTNASLDYETLSSNTYNSTLHSAIGDSCWLETVDPLIEQQRPKNIPATAKSVKHIPISGSGSSDHSDDMQSLQTISLELVDQSLLSDIYMNSTSQTTELDDELKRLKLELAQVTEKYKVICQESANAREKFLHPKEGSKIEEAALAIIDMESKKSKAAVEMAEKSQHIAELETQKRKHIEKKFKIEAAERQKAVNELNQNAIGYRKYTIEEIEHATNYFSDSEKIGEGGYGPVYKGNLDHTPVAIKMLRQDIEEGQTQFQREIEVLSRMRHPNMVILLGACPMHGCLIYEYMENGSLEDRLYRKDGTRPLSWPTRFRIAAEIATALNFLHQRKPEPLVHRDLKPANILLDKNYISKISDVGLSRLVPASVADSVTQYRMTTAAGTFCYIDPEYQQTGMLGTKSDIYSLGVMLLQIITARPAMGLTYHVENAIERGQFAEVLDPTVMDWPVEEALSFAKLALKCTELRKRDRPNLDSVILPELERLRELGSKVTAYYR